MCCNFTSIIPSRCKRHGRDLLTANDPIATSSVNNNVGIDIFYTAGASITSSVNILNK